MKLLRTGNNNNASRAAANRIAKYFQLLGYLFGSFLPLLACEGSSAPNADAGTPPPAGSVDAAVVTGAQVPPMGQAAIEPWLAAGSYTSWRCETDIFPMRLNGAHGRHRICSNDLVYQDGVDFPVGAASVKELFDAMNRPFGWAVGIKIASGSGPHTWYWYERIGRLATLSPVADGVGVRECGPMCHAAAPRDNVFLKAP